MKTGSCALDLLLSFVCTWRKSNGERSTVKGLQMSIIMHHESPHSHRYRTESRPTKTELCQTDLTCCQDFPFLSVPAISPFLLIYATHVTKYLSLGAYCLALRATRHALSTYPTTTDPNKFLRLALPVLVNTSAEIRKLKSHSPQSNTTRLVSI